MAKFIEKKEPSEARYLFEVTQQEADLLLGLLYDLSTYGLNQIEAVVHDSGTVKLTGRGRGLVNGLYEELGESVPMPEDYNYFDYWEVVDLPKAAESDTI